MVTERLIKNENYYCTTPLMVPGPEGGRKTLRLECGCVLLSPSGSPWAKRLLASVSVRRWLLGAQCGAACQGLHLLFWLRRKSIGEASHGFVLVCFALSSLSLAEDH